MSNPNIPWTDTIVCMYIVILISGLSIGFLTRHKLAHNLDVTAAFIFIWSIGTLILGYKLGEDNP